MRQMTLAFALLISFNQAFAGSFKLISNTSEPQVLKVLNDIEKELPDVLKNAINKEVMVHFKNLNSKELEGLSVSCSEKIVLGSHFLLPGNTKIDIDNVFIKEILKGNRAINCPHKSIYTYFKATVVHEIAHIFDNNKKVSDDPLFLNITGWIAKGLVVRQRTNLNQLNSRSPDRYEFKSIMETFAVNFEHFLYDTEFKCRRPTYYEFYSKLFNTDSDKTLGCESNDKIAITYQGIKDHRKAEDYIKEMDFSRLYQIHYLFAGKGEQVMSRFGHAMYRLVFCAPGTQMGPKCMNDIGYHIVLSFRASVQDLKLDYAKGMNGDYPSQLFFLSLHEVIDEYTKGEFREVTSLPLKLTPVQMKRFLQRSSELFWGYQGKYFFLTNNCATESMNILRVAVGEVDDTQTKNIVTPIGLYDYLVKSKLADTSVLKDMTVAQSKGYYYPGVTKKIIAALKTLGIPESNLEKFSMNKAAQRMEYYQKALDGSDKKVMIAANILQVEDLILKSKELLFTKLMGEKLFGADADPRLTSTELGQRVKDLVNVYNELGILKFTKDGYGIPLRNEFDGIPQSAYDLIFNKAKDYTNDIKLLTEEFFPEEIAEIKGSKDNRARALLIIAKSIQ